MKIDVGDLLKKLGNDTMIRTEEHLSFPEDGLSIEGPVNVSLHLVNVGGSILATGDFKARVNLSCVRCLKEFQCPVEVSVEEEYSKSPKAFSQKGEEIELKDEDFVFKIGEDNAIDLSEAIRQNLLTALPIKPLCRKSCKVVEMPPAKEKKAPDPRLAKLKDVFKK